MTRKYRPTKKVALLAVIALLVNTFAYFFYVEYVRAGDLTEASIRLDRMQASETDVDILVVVKAATTGTEDDILIDFTDSSPGFTVDGTASNVTISTSSLPSTYQGEALTAMPVQAGTASAVTGGQGGDVEIDITDLTVGTLYGVFITAGVDNPGTAGQEYQATITIRDSGDATIDSKQVATNIVASGNDQVSVTASVGATFSFTLGSNSCALGTLNTSTMTTCTVSVDIDTNAGNGWIAWLKSANAGLTSTATSDTIDTQGTVDDSPTTGSAGSEYYQLDVDTTDGTGSGTPSTDAEYDGDTDGTPDPGSGGTFSSTYEEIAISDGPGTNDGLSLIALAGSSATNEAATDYADTWTVIGAGNF